ncbi:MAG: primosomal protein N' [Bacteroidales bacterium]|nr:primosomal protein N' [Bacteroidales bacterium]MDD4684543.1 primosomal protein N' [Bacteroidales bacterium]
MSERITLFAEVILPLPLPSTYTYRIPFEWNDLVKKGQRVVVQLGNKKIYSGIVFDVHDKAPKVSSVKYILSILDEEPIISELSFSLWLWVASYYMCYLGDVMSAALPSALRLKSETKIIMHPDFDGDITSLSEDESKVFEVVSRKESIEIKDAIETTGNNNILPLLNSMIRKNLIITEEELNSKYRPKVEEYISISNNYKDEEKLKELFTRLESKKTLQKQYEAILIFLSLAKNKDNEIKKSDLTKQPNISASAIKTLIRDEVFHIEKKIQSRLVKRESNLSVDKLILSEEQSIAYNSIIEKWDEKPVSLIHGITGSGKTELYIKLINDVIKEGRQVLFLLPEIALTSHLITRLEKYFGNRIGVFHSRFSNEERIEIWNKVRNPIKESRYDIILGSRSSIFLPFIDLGLIIVDEEHDPSYKQYDPSPRYNARDTAIVLANLHKAKTVLGSATPSLESYFNAKDDKYQLLELKQRYSGTLLPEVFLADIKESTKAKKMYSHFTKTLLENMGEALKNKEQIILFQNRRGFARHLQCEACSWIPSCERCDVSLTYHKQSELLKCHYCGYSINIPQQCPECNSHGVKMVGFGTEKIEEDLNIFFPDARIARMDLDTTRAKSSYETLITDFQDRKIDILVGTQMITKGLDFDNVSIVGILNADSIINFPDFRSYERAFQQMVQVSGRAGRKFKRGRVIIQTFNPYHPAIKDVISSDYNSMYESQILERKVFKYPPFYRLIKISLRHREKNVVDKSSEEFALEIRKIFGGRILGPEYPLIPRIRNYYSKEFWLKVEKEASITQVKQEIKVLMEKFQASHKQLRISIDVDPV